VRFAGFSRRKPRRPKTPDERRTTEADDRLFPAGFGHFFEDQGGRMGRAPTLPPTLAGQAFRKGEDILATLDADGADFIGLDEHRMYMWHRDQLVNLWDHQHLLDFLTEYGYLGKRTENKMIIAAWIIFEATKRCA
jgi:hypothetical protein